MKDTRDLQENYFFACNHASIYDKTLVPTTCWWVQITGVNREWLITWSGELQGYLAHKKLPTPLGLP